MENGQQDILELSDVKLLVDTFYSKVQLHPVLAPVFNQRIGDNWGPHLDKMYRFWQTVLLEEYTYHGRPFPPHAQLPIDHTHFEAWLQLFNTTVDELFTGDKATEAKWRAAKMAEMFNLKLQYFRDHPNSIQ